MCFVLFVYAVSRWSLEARLDRDDPFGMVLKTCHHLRAEGMSWSTRVHASREENRRVNKLVYNARKILQQAVNINSVHATRIYVFSRTFQGKVQ